MKAIVCEEFGPIDTLVFKDVEAPEPAKGEVRINVKATGVNFPDGLLVQGLYQVQPERPFIPGMEFCGEVESLGEGVKHLKVGQRLICSSQKYGGFAEQAVVNSKLVMPIPDEMNDIDAANIMCAHGTAHHALKQRARLKSGETLVVLGAAGGTGLAAVQIGKAMGAKVIAVCSSQDKLEIAKEQGADELVNYKEQDLKQALKDLTKGKGVDVVYDPVGGEAFDACTRAMARNGRLLVIGFASGTIPKLPVNLALVKEYSVIGVFWGSFVMHEPMVFLQNMQELFAWHKDGKVSVVTDEVFTLANTKEALAKVFNREVKGKVVVVAE
ncbi:MULTISPECIES: NADPH:quinone oxidoreductase family protein [unclassified Oleiphilus]|jgi:NADPH2:quinone reductase|nr:MULTISPECIES: NADPH:quinone oxidoreductase family protein [unclassified Oleiphilus]KZY50763.1 NADPH:quinone oxidoreductase [Oleiphilus sp. HI0050]KZY75019.1 NADPH:quinone oxidoreductase [Oleiphilus sp. HI0068]KZY88217.1 NADPH:quinone oxidoreductase [Oleiphilus sp. HI0069]KZY89024.1 NADPH:quinone oxidoreductase [Oleiphilus sp. HI0072]KZZ11230.1 NADPH:quinone oxidoreductase [Oleiphilus sp. HI0078]KZZ21805.1 NADPH:quinone oxidoreductase [Oleiphilus sp. HI0081]